MPDATDPKTSLQKSDVKALGRNYSRPWFGAFERSLAWRYLFAKREHGGASLISIVSFVGIALAVWALITTMSVMEGFRTKLLEVVLGGQPHIYVQVEGATKNEVEHAVETIQSLTGVVSVDPYIEQKVLVSFRGRATGAAVKAFPSDGLKSLPFLDEKYEDIIASGYGQGKNGGNQILIGRVLASQLGVVTGDDITIVVPQINQTIGGAIPRSKAYEVSTVFTTGSVELDSLFIFMPIEQGRLLAKFPSEAQNLDIRVSDPDDTTSIMREIRNSIGPKYYIYDWKRQRSSWFNALNVERMMMLIVMLVLVSITSLNIITGVVMLVKNKTRDIAILRTIGAGRGMMMRVFILIGATLGFAGAMSGFALGLLTVLNISAVEAGLNLISSSVGGGPIFSADVYGLSGLPAKLDYPTALIATFWAMCMSVIVTIWPAWRGASLDPVEALRFE